jgi:hypothetical protein
MTRQLTKEVMGKEATKHMNTDGSWCLVGGQPHTQLHHCCLNLRAWGCPVDIRQDLTIEELDAVVTKTPYKSTLALDTIDKNSDRGKREGDARLS